MAGVGFDIAQLKGTPLYQLAKNANIYGGETLSKTEMVFFKQQCREMGFNPEDYGLNIVSEDVEGETYKETIKNQENLNKSITNSFKTQFGQKNAYEVAQQAETKAYAMILTAKDAFINAHGKQLQFTPEALGNKPNPMDTKYSKNMTQYVADLNGWAKDVAKNYTDASHLTNEQLAALIMKNDDRNAQMNAAATVAVGEAVIENDDLNSAHLEKHIQDNTTKIIKEVRNDGQKTRATITAAEGKITDAIGKAEDNITDKVDKTANETQVLGGISEKITTNLSEGSHLNGTRDRVNNMRNKILQSNLSFDKKKELLTHLAAFSTQRVMTASELSSEEDKINNAIKASIQNSEGDKINDVIKKGVEKIAFPWSDKYNQ
jgi:hypothetical protein